MYLLKKKYEIFWCFFYIEEFLAIFGYYYMKGLIQSTFMCFDLTGERMIFCKAGEMI